MLHAFIYNNNHAQNTACSHNRFGRRLISRRAAFAARHIAAIKQVSELVTCRQTDLTWIAIEAGAHSGRWNDITRRQVMFIGKVAALQ